MRTNVVLNDQLVSRAFRCSKIKTKKQLIDTALREFVAHHSRKDLKELKGKIHILKDYDYKALRAG